MQTRPGRCKISPLQPKSLSASDGRNERRLNGHRFFFANNIWQQLRLILRPSATRRRGTRPYGREHGPILAIRKTSTLDISSGDRVALTSSSHPRRLLRRARSQSPSSSPPRSPRTKILDLRNRQSVTKFLPRSVPARAEQAQRWCRYRGGGSQLERQRCCCF